jgi:hypothetical protein
MHRSVPGSGALKAWEITMIRSFDQSVAIAKAKLE